MKKLTIFLCLAISVTVFATTNPNVVSSERKTDASYEIRGVLVNKLTGQQISVSIPLKVSASTAVFKKCGNVTYNNVNISYTNGCNWQWNGSMTINTCVTTIADFVNAAALSIYNSHLAGTPGCPQVPFPEYTTSY